MFSRILACSDLAPVSASAVRTAAELGRVHGAEVIVLHVVDLPADLRAWSTPGSRADARLFRALAQRHQRAAETELKKQLGALLDRGAAPRVMVRSGSPGEVIAAVVAELAVDLVIVARGSGGALGSVAERVVRLVGRTVMVTPVRAPRVTTSRRAAWPVATTAGTRARIVAALPRRPRKV